MNTKPKILIVDDKPANLKALRTVLNDFDLELIEATNGNDALKATIYHDFALALVDIQMPEMDGYELAAILSKEVKTAQLPIIFISAVYTDNIDVYKGYERGAFSFITKPFQPEILINKVKFFIAKHHQEIALFELNEELKKSNKDLESFTYSVSHDLRAPLRSIKNYSQVLKADFGSMIGEDGLHLIERINEKSRKMSILIDDLLAFAKLGQKEISKTKIDMKEMAINLKSEMNLPASSKVVITIGNLHKVNADYSLLHQVMFNLISNAIKYSSHKELPVIEISSVEKDCQIIFSIKDNGAGFDMKHSSKLFGVFQRLHSAEEFEGTGVGLAIVKRVIENHQGNVWAEGKVNEGATFYFTLPAN